MFTAPSCRVRGATRMATCWWWEWRPSVACCATKRGRGRERESENEREREREATVFEHEAEPGAYVSARRVIMVERPRDVSSTRPLPRQQMCSHDGLLAACDGQQASRAFTGFLWALGTMGADVGWGKGAKAIAMARAKQPSRPAVEIV